MSDANINTSEQQSRSEQVDSTVSADSDSILENFNDQLSARYDIQDLALILLSALSMSYASLVLFNTGNFNVDVQSTVTTFGYIPEVSAMAAAVLLYLFAFLCLISVESDWAPSLTVISWVTSVLYLGVGVIFHENVFDRARVRTQVQGGKTDAYVLQREGADRFLDGTNPYLSDYSEEILAQVPGYFRTPLSPNLAPEDVNEPVNIVTTLDYPPISFLWYLPSELLGISGTMQDLFAMGLIMTVLLIIAPKSLRLLIPVFFMLNKNMILFPVSYVPDTAWIFFVITAIFTVHYPKTNAVIWALAANYRPQPVLIASFFAIFVYKEFGLPYIKQWVPVGLLATALINLPFAIWTGPSTYWAYITIPVRINIPPGGVGPAMVFGTDLVSSAAATGQVQSVFSYVVYATWVLSLIGVYKYYDRLGVGALAFPGFILWFHWRSFENYLLWFPLFVFTAYLIGFPEQDPVKLLLHRIRDIQRQIKQRVSGFRSDNKPVPTSMDNQQ